MMVIDGNLVITSDIDFSTQRDSVWFNASTEDEGQFLDYSLDETDFENATISKDGYSIVISTELSLFPISIRIFRTSPIDFREYE